jgi:hypothetical protein
MHLFRATARALPLAVLALLPAATQAAAAALPAPPATYLNTGPVAPSGRTITVNAGGDFQGALNAAQPGDVIALQPGAAFTGPFTLPNKSGAGWITIRSATADSNLPAPGTRVTPAHAGVMPKLQGPNSQAAITTAAGAHHYRFVGVEIRPVPGTYTFGLVLLGTGGERDVNALPSNIVFDRCYIHGDPTLGGKRGVAVNSRSTAIIDSHLSDWKGQGQDTQAIAGWNGPGPFKIVNNYIEGAGENVMFGGSDPAITNLVPSDIEFRRNLVAKPLSWNHNDPGAYAGSRWSIKNLFELKNAARVLVDGNIFQNNWVDAQSGFAVQLTVRNQDGGAPWSTLRDITFTNNVIRNSAAGINVLGRDDLFASDQTQRVLIKNNVFENIGGPRLGTNGRLLQLISSATDVIFDHNTAMGTGNVITAAGGDTLNFVFRNNIVPHNDYGVIGDGTGVGNSTLTAYFPGSQFVRNVLAGGNAAAYPADNFFPASLSGVGFMNMSGGDYRLATSSPYRSAGTDGKDLGADLEAIEDALDGVNPPTGGTSGGGTTAGGGTSTGDGTSTGGATPTGGGSTTGCPCTIFASTTPAVASAADPDAVELGVKFRASANGFITGLRFYKGAQNTGTHIGHLWSSTGSLLGSVTFTGETASGWQQASFPTPIAVTANTVYVASYYAPNGGYAFNANFFAGTTGVTRGPLTALGTGTSPNGVFRYGPSGFPNETFNAANYWVDVVFAATAGATGGDTTAPTLAITAPAANSVVSGTVNVQLSATDNVGINRIELRVDGILVGTYPGTTRTIPWDSRKVADGSHTLVVRAVDNAGNGRDASRVVTVRQPQPASVRITTPSAGATLPTSLAIGIQATDGAGVRTVTLYADGIRINTFTCSGTTCTGSFTWVTDQYLGSGTHTLFAVSTNAQGVQLRSANVTVTR